MAASILFSACQFNFRARALGILALTAVSLSPLISAEEPKPSLLPATSDAELAIRRFHSAPGLKVDLWAAEPMLANPVAFNFDERGRLFLCETYRLHAGVDDILGIMDLLDDELACRTVDHR